MKKRKPAPDWFGCGKVITTASWNGFLKARKEYYEKKDAEEAKSKTTENHHLILPPE